MKSYPRTIKDDIVVFDPFRGQLHEDPYRSSGRMETSEDQVLIRVLLPPRSLLILYGAAR